MLLPYARSYLVDKRHFKEDPDKEDKWEMSKKYI